MPKGHYKRKSAVNRIYDKLLKKKSGCWQYIGKLDKNGYGRVRDNYTRKLIHRAMYEHLIGRIPDKMVIDHLCRNRGCVNPSHMEVVTQRENILRGYGVTARNSRKLNCKRGHGLNGENLYMTTKGSRQCIKCRNILGRKYYHQQKNAQGLHH